MQYDPSMAVPEPATSSFARGTVPATPRASGERPESAPAGGIAEPGVPAAVREDCAPRPEPPAKSAAKTDGDPPGGLIGRSYAMEGVRRMVDKIGPTDTTVLITGETGTGKELVARLIHARSERAPHPLIAVNCGSIPESLLESQLFGHVRGAFTGADKDKRGLMEAAGRGTLLLDEIGELPPALQPKILRALETREVLPVGSTTTVPVAARLLVATHRELSEMVQRDLFRADLYYRLNVVEIHVPPLRERAEDVPLLAIHLLGVHCRKLRRPVPGIEPTALQRLAEYPWPGNVRELANVLERLCILIDGDTIRVSDLPPLFSARTPAIQYDLREACRCFELQHIHQVLQVFGGDKRRAARALGINLSSLYRKLRHDDE